MTINALPAIGTILARTGTDIAEVTTISGPTQSADVLDVTTQESGGTREKRRGLLDSGQLSFDMYYIPTDTSHKALLADFQDGSTGPSAWTITFPDSGSSQWTLSAKVNGFELTANFDGVLTASVTLEVSGAVGTPP